MEGRCVLSCKEVKMGTQQSNIHLILAYNDMWGWYEGEGYFIFQMLFLYIFFQMRGKSTGMRNRLRIQ